MPHQMDNDSNAWNGSANQPDQAKQIADIVSSLLGVDVEKIDLDQDLFALGAHSLMLVKLVLEIERMPGGMRIPLDRIFRMGPYLSVRNIARLLADPVGV